jgi:hypothetical protein
MPSDYTPISLAFVPQYFLIVTHFLAHLVRSPHLYKATRSLIDLYRALMPVHHARALTNVPALAILFYNDCMYIARELEKIPARLEDGIPGMDEVQYDESIPALKSLARKWFNTQLVRFKLQKVGLRILFSTYISK